MEMSAEAISGGSGSNIPPSSPADSLNVNGDCELLVLAMDAGLGSIGWLDSGSSEVDVCNGGHVMDCASGDRSAAATSTWEVGTSVAEAREAKGVSGRNRSSPSARVVGGFETIAEVAR